MLTNPAGIVPIAIVFVGIVLSLVEAGLFWFAIHIYSKGNRKLGLLFSFTLLWTIFLIIQVISYNLGSEVMRTNAYVLGGILLLVFVFHVPFIKGYSKAPAIVLFLVALTAFSVALLVDYNISDLRTLSAFLLIVPPIMGYILFMKEVIKIVQ